MHFKWEKMLATYLNECILVNYSCKNDIKRIGKKEVIPEIKIKTVLTYNVHRFYLIFLIVITITNPKCMIYLIITQDKLVHYFKLINFIPSSIHFTTTTKKLFCNTSLCLNN